ncbi:MAG: adenylate/guanylate cyclase domain-containing protein [Proteobacteria bacterium]|nr:adenylate/guanylate cyclase domain-containing protein [Pseudomonadota bacterium]
MTAWFARFTALYPGLKSLARNKLLFNVLTVALAALAMSAIASYAVDHLAFLISADRFVKDLEIATRAPIEPQDEDVRVVAVDDGTLRNFPYTAPLDRHFLAQLLLALDAQHPRVIVLDYLFDKPTEPAKDEELRAVIRALKTPLVVSYFGAGSHVSAPQLAYLNAFVPKKFRAAANIGTDQTDTVRFITPSIRTPDGQVLPTVPHRVADMLGIAAPKTQVNIAWRGDPGVNQPAFAQYSACITGFEGCLPMQFYPPPVFKGKVVLIGSDQTLIDQHRTPFAAAPWTGKSFMPGIVTLAYAIAQFIDHRTDPELDWWQDFLIALLFGATGAFLGLFDYQLVLRTVTIVVLVAILWGGGVFILYERMGILIGLLAPTISLIGAFAAVESITGIDARRQRQFIHNTFSLYLPPSFVQQLVDDPDKLVLGGERRDLSLLFTDIHGFTTMAEGLDSKDVGRVLNGYLDGMTAAVRKHEGTVDKFIGDAVFALWNAPLDVADYATKAVRCALDMDLFTEEFRLKMNAEGIPLSYTRIGVHAGAAAVGNFGSADRFSYTASGDAVNAASRLEGLNKTFGTRICVSDAAKVLCQGITFRPIGSVILKGKTEALDVWEPLHDGAVSDDYLARYGAAFEAARAHDDAAPGLFAALAAENPADPLVAFYVERLATGEAGIKIKMTEK